MVMDDPARAGRRAASSFPALIVVAVAVTLLLSAGSFLAACWLLRPTPEEAPAAAPVATAEDQGGPAPFRDWPRPDVAIVLTGQMHGYLQPCGCSPIQLGGLARRFNMMQTLHKRGWAVAAGDLGDIAQTNGPQALLKYQYAMKALKLLNYSGIAIGANEIALPPSGLFSALGEFALNERSPRVLAANLKDKEAKFPEMVGSSVVSGGHGSAPRVGFVGIVGPSVAKLSQDPEARFDPEDKALNAALAELHKQNAELLVLLYEGSAEEAKACATRFPQFPVILCLDKTEEPSGRPEQIGNTLVIAVGHKGRYVGVVGAFRSKAAGHPFEFRYELVALDPEYETPPGKDKDNPIHALLQEYAEKVRDGNYLAKYAEHPSKHPVQIDYPKAAYVGSEQCKKCHEAEYAVWAGSAHPHAYETLVEKARRPSLRQYDGECVACHVVGFGYTSGYRNERDTPQLRGVGCESCHGPASLHVENSKNKEIRASLNPWKRKAKNNPQQLANQIDLSCQKCHDQDNSVGFKFEKYWEKIKH